MKRRTFNNQTCTMIIQIYIRGLSLESENDVNIAQNELMHGLDPSAVILTAIVTTGNTL